jgi:hypothetical protein
MMCEKTLQFPNDVGDDDDDADARRLRKRQKPNHERDQPTREDAAHEQRKESVIHALQTDFLDRLAYVWLDRVGVPHQPRDREGADQIRDEDDDPETRDVPKGAQVMLAQQRQDDGERVLGEQLLPAKDDNEETDAVAEPRNQWAPRRVRKMTGEDTFAEQREPHRNLRGQTRPRECAFGSVKLVPAFLFNRRLDNLPVR